MKKLTLSMDIKDIRAARRLAKERGTSVSRMFAHLVRAMSSRPKLEEEELPPMTRRLVGMCKLPPGRTWEQELDAAIQEKHGPF